MSEKIVVKVDREAAEIELKVTTARIEKSRKKFESRSHWPLITRGPFAALFYGLFLYPKIFFDHIIMENPAYSSFTIRQEAIVRTVKWSMNSPLKTMRKSGSFLGSLIKTFRCSENFQSLKKNVRIEMGVKSGYWLGPKKYKQKECDAIILYLHGGGYVALSSLIGLSSLCYLIKILRKRYNKHVRVLAIDYDKAPEDPYPCAINCSERVYRWLINSGIVGSKNVFLCGDSAGAGLSLALLQKLYPDGSNDTSLNENIILPLGVILSSPWVDLLCDSSSYSRNAKFDWISGNLGQFAAEYYIFGKEGNPARKKDQSKRNSSKNTGTITDWLEKIEDDFEFFDFDGMSRFKRFSRELVRRLSYNSRRRSNIRRRNARIQQRNSRFSREINIGPQESLDEFRELKFPSEEEESSSNKKSSESNTEENSDSIKFTNNKGYYTRNLRNNRNTRYVKHSEEDSHHYRNPLISPLHIPHHVLAKFPPLFISYGGKEIFRDDIEMFTQKCIESKRVYTSFGSSDYVDDSLDGQHPDIVVEMDEDMIHDYPMFIDVFGKRSKKALDRMAHFIANRIPLLSLSRPRSKYNLNKSKSMQSLSESAVKFYTVPTVTTIVSDAAIINADDESSSSSSKIRSVPNSRRIPSVYTINSYQNSLNSINSTNNTSH